MTPVCRMYVHFVTKLGPTCQMQVINFMQISMQGYPIANHQQNYMYARPIPKKIIVLLVDRAPELTLIFSVKCQVSYHLLICICQWSLFDIFRVGTLMTANSIHVIPFKCLRKMAGAWPHTLGQVGKRGAPSHD